MVVRLVDARLFDGILRRQLPQKLHRAVEARLVRHGFYPRGGGRIEVDITPAPLQPIDCCDRGPLLERSATALFGALPFAIAERMVKTARKKLPDWPEDAFAVRELPVDQGPGIVLLLEATFEHVTEVVSGFGKLGVTAERIANTAAGRMAGYVASDAFAGPYLQDQLLLPFALAGGGSFTTVKPSQHSCTAVDIIERFTGRRCIFEVREGESNMVTVR